MATKTEQNFHKLTVNTMNLYLEQRNRLARELRHLVRLLEPLERDGRLDIPGFATLNGAREALKDIP